MIPLSWPVRSTAWLLLGFIVLPFLIVVPVSLTDRAYLSLPQNHLSLAHYGELLEDSGWMTALLRSVIIASATTLLAVMIGSACAFGCRGLPTRAVDAVRAMVLLPLIIPSVVQGLAFYRTWVDLRIANTYAGVILAHTITAIPFVFIAVSAALVSIDSRFEMAARSLGAGTRRVVLWVLVPMALPGVLSGALFAFVHSFDELVLVLFITNRGVETLPKRMWLSLQDDLTPIIACVAVLIGLLTLALLIMEFALRSRQMEQHG